MVWNAREISDDHRLAGSGHGGVSRISRGALDSDARCIGSCLFPVSTVLMCVEIPEVCISLPLNRCVKAPEGMGAPFMNTSTAETENFVYRPPLENADAVPSLHQKNRGSNSHPWTVMQHRWTLLFLRATCCWHGWRWTANAISTFTVVAASWFSFSAPKSGFHSREGSHDTPWKINMEPQNEGLEDDSPFQVGDF